MDNLILTILIAAILMGVVVAALGIGLILTGKSRLKKGCGMAPSKKKEGQCPLCGTEKKCEEEKQEENHERGDR
ncbi:MAG: hypothetical protein WAM28_09080 [Chlamydiales bacterium]